MALKSPIRLKPEIIKREHRYAAAAARGAFAHDRAVCPRCGSGSLLPTAEREFRGRNKSSAKSYAKAERMVNVMRRATSGREAAKA